MANDIVKLVVELSGKGFDSLGKSIDQLERGVHKAGMAFTAFGAAVAAPLALATRAAIKFSEDWSQVIVQLEKTDQAAASLDKLKGDLESIASGTGLAVADVTKATFLALSSGVEKANLKGFLEDTSKAAVGGFAALSDVVNISTSALDAYRSTGLKTKDALDLMFQAAKFGKMEFKDMAASLGPVLPISSAAGVSFKETAAAVAALTRSGFNTAESVTALRGALVSVYKPTSEAAQMAEALGIKFDVTSLKSMGLARFMQQIADATRDLPDREEVMAKLFGDVRGLAAVLALTNNNSILLKESLDALGSSAGAVDDAFNTVKENDIGFVWRQLGVAWDILVEKIGNAVATTIGPALTQFVDWLNGAENALAAISGVHLGDMGEGVFKSLDGLLQSVVGSAKEFDVVMRNGVPVGMREVATEAEPLSEKIKNIAISFMDWTAKVIEFVKNHKDLVLTFLEWGAIAAVLGPAILVVGQLVSVVGNLFKLFKTIGSFLGPWGLLAAAIVGVIVYWDEIKQAATDFFTEMGLMSLDTELTWTILWENIKFLAGEAWIWAKEKAGEFIDWFKESFPSVTKLIEDMASDFADVIVQWEIDFGILWNSIKENITWLFNKINDAKNYLAKFVPDFLSSSPAPGAQVSVPSNAEDMPQFAHGGLVTQPTVALIGEAGPEYVIPANKMGSVGPTVNVTSTMADARLVAQEVARILRQQQRLSA